MGWKGAMRTMQAEARRAEKRQIQYEKMQQVDRARDLVEEQNDYLERIISIHHVHTDKVNWFAINELAPPVEPIKTSVLEEIATLSLKNYQPSWVIRKLNLVDWRKNSFNKKITEANKKDEINYKTSLAKFNAEYEYWKKNNTLSSRILSKDLDAYEEIIRSKPIFIDGTLKFASLSLSFEGDILVAEIDLIKESDLLPSKIYSVTKTGKVSEKDLPSTKYNQLYQDYACSASLAVAKLLFNLFPIDKILVNAMAEVLNTSNGHQERQTLLSVYMPRASIQNINFNQIDPSDCMKNFIHKMDYKNTDGMRPVKKLDINNNQAS